MGMFQSQGCKKEKIPCGTIEAFREFGSSLFEATEVEKLNLEFLSTLDTLPLSFFYLNAGLDLAIQDLQRNFPDANFILKEHTSKE
jgi:hypothetical protein